MLPVTKKAIYVRGSLRVLSNYLGMTRTVLLVLKSVGTIDSQSDLRIGGAKCRVHSQARKLPVREKLNVVSFILVSDLLSLKTQRVLKGL